MFSMKSCSPTDCHFSVFPHPPEVNCCYGVHAEFRLSPIHEHVRGDAVPCGCDTIFPLGLGSQCCFIDDSVLELLMQPAPVGRTGLAYRVLQPLSRLIHEKFIQE